MRDASTPKLNLATKIFHVDSFVVLFSSIFLLCGDLKFDLMFFIQLIWWIRACQIFKTFDQAKMLQILLHTLTNLFDSANLIKLIWPCISGDMSIVDWFKWLCYFRFLLKNSFGKPFCQILYFSQSFYLFCVIPCYVKKKQYCFDFQWSLSSRWLPWFSHAVVLSTRFFYHWIMFSYYNKDTQRNQNKVIIGKNIVSCFSHLSVLSVNNKILVE